VADGRHPGKIEKLPYLRNSLTNCHEIWHGDAVSPSWPLQPLNFQNFKIQDGGGCHTEKSKD